MCSGVVVLVDDFLNIIITINCINFVSDINECESNPCRYKGICTDLLNRYRCKCAAGYTGSRCGTSMYDTNTDVNYDCFVCMS